MKRTATAALNDGISCFDPDTGTYVCSFPRDPVIMVDPVTEAMVVDHAKILDQEKASSKIIMEHPSTQEIPERTRKQFADDYVQGLPFMTKEEVEKPCIASFFGRNYGDIQPAIKAAWDFLNSEKKRKPRKKSRRTKCTERK